MRIGIIAGESSGDMLGAGLIAAIREKYPDARFEGVAGEQMIAQGCNALYPSDMLSVVGLIGFKQYNELKSVRKKLIEHFINNPPDVFVGIDVPDFNLKLEEKLHHAGIKTVQYVSPQVWAWRRYRVRLISRAVDLLLTLFPFEDEFYKQQNVEVQYVGHPLADKLALVPDRHAARDRLGISQTGEIIAILPGSRISEVRNLASILLDTIEWCLQEKPDLRFLIPFASGAVRKEFESSQQGRLRDLPVILFEGQARSVMEASNVVLLASGTATLEALMMKRPMVVTYKVSSLFYWFIQRLVRVRHFSLPNLLAGEALIPELVQNDATAENLGFAVLDFLDNPGKVEELIQRFTQIHETLRQDTNRKAAQAVLELATS
ncbi:MAG: lipid-A-disaccharide synthase [Gammaproteobacteria bacterium]|nr:MAG: lipid-A-disaccharide synthase [Gammaproteobacteria bacterium]